MVSCAYVFLFMQMPDLKNDPIDRSKLTQTHLERLLILGSDQSRSFYGAYKNPTPGMFPVANSQLHITTTLNKNIYMGTNFKAYCSASNSALEIAKSLVHSESMKTISHQNFISTNTRDQNCLKQIKQLSIQGHNSEPISAASLVSSGVCTNGNIINLAYRSLISVSGTFHQFAPSKPRVNQQVNMDQAIDFKEIVRIEQVYAIWTERNTKYILVWYFGYLHVFKRQFNNTVWLPVTKIGEEKNNGAIIENYIRRHTNVLKTLDGQIRSLGLKFKISKICNTPGCHNDRMKKTIGDLMVQIGSTEPFRNVPITWAELNSDL
ncbi:BgTH12-07660 [Blumeria graminis f. sp. triticale]|uniref:BgTH12-07660 n=1 Tax=Blumeria graminis f. sp. triticale TaxID=1689686 RepID=A0A9W4GCE5_BLUGR|nr:BgTH12-07660 [Blumeria graminis f. sp. triticale]